LILQQGLILENGKPKLKLPSGKVVELKNPFQEGQWLNLNDVPEDYSVYVRGLVGSVLASIVRSQHLEAERGRIEAERKRNLLDNGPPTSKRVASMANERLAWQNCPERSASLHLNL